MDVKITGAILVFIGLLIISDFVMGFPPALSLTVAFVLVLGCAYMLLFLIRRALDPRNTAITPIGRVDTKMKSDSVLEKNIIFVVERPVFIACIIVTVLVLVTGSPVGNPVLTALDGSALFLSAGISYLALGYLMRKAGK